MSALEFMIVVPGNVYHAELEGPLKPKPMASYKEIIEMLSYDPIYEKEANELVEVYLADVNRRGPEQIGSAWRLPDLNVGRFAAKKVRYDPEDGKGMRGAKGRGTVITGALLETFRLFKQTNSMSETARQLGISVNTVRDRLISLEIKILRRAGFEPGTVAENRRGRIVKTNLGRPTLEEIKERKAA